MRELNQQELYLINGGSPENVMGGAFFGCLTGCALRFFMEEASFSIILGTGALLATFMALVDPY